jgi:hypothetical protein
MEEGERRGNGILERGKKWMRKRDGGIGRGRKREGIKAEER